MGIEALCLGLHNRESWLSYQESKVKVHDGSPVVSWAQRKGQRDTATAGRVADIHTPSIVDLSTWLPCLKVTGGRSMGWANRMGSCKPRLLQKLVILALQILPFISAIRMI